MQKYSEKIKILARELDQALKDKGENVKRIKNLEEFIMTLLEEK